MKSQLEAFSALLAGSLLQATNPTALPVMAQAESPDDGTSLSDLNTFEDWSAPASSANIPSQATPYDAASNQQVNEGATDLPLRPLVQTTQMVMPPIVTGKQATLPSVTEAMTNAANVSTTAGAASTGAELSTELTPLNRPQNTSPTQRLFMDDVPLDGAIEIDMDGKAGKPAKANLFQTEAMQRDSFYNAAALAETSRQVRPTPLVSLLQTTIAARPSRTLSEHSQTSPDPELPNAQTATLSPNNFPPVSASANSMPDARALVGQITQPIITVAEMIAKREARSIRVRLHPEELGEIELRISRDSLGLLNARISTEHETARHILSLGINHLRATLEQAGLNVDRLDVFVQSNHSQSTSGQQAQAQEQSHQERFAVPEPSLSDQPPIPELADTPESRLLNMRA